MQSLNHDQAGLGAATGRSVFGRHARSCLALGKLTGGVGAQWSSPRGREFLLRTSTKHPAGLSTLLTDVTSVVHPGNTNTAKWGSALVGRAVSVAINRLFNRERESSETTGLL